MFRSRVVMFSASSIWIALILVVLVFRGGGAVPVEPALQPAVPSSAASLAQQAAELADRGDYEGAWRLYHEALLVRPEDVSLWYALGVTLSRLNQREETETAFRYVLNRGNPDSEEVRLARQWLVSAGVLAPSDAFRSATAAGTATVADDKAAVKGKVTWGEPGRDGPATKARIVLQGLSGAAEGKRFTTRVSMGQPYRIEHLPVGSYRLIGRVGDRLLWDQTVDVEDGRATVLDLSRENSNTPTVALNQ